MLSNDFHLEMYRRLLRIRGFEDHVVASKKRGAIVGPLHTCTGQEGEIVGACMALEETDYMVGNHRSHGHPIGKGAQTRALMAEIFGRATGINRGKGGSMHLADFGVGSLGETSIVGSGLPVATGAALGAKMQGSGRVSLCFFGDGASNEGTFHESLNLASIWKLPVVFLCENNGYAITVSIKDVIAIPDIATRAAAYGMPGHIVDGQDALAVYETVRAAVERARAGEGPSLVEAKTYRFVEHAPGLSHVHYRSEEEVEQWKQRDPIALFRRQMIDRDLLAAADLDAAEDEVAAELEDAVRFAEASPFPDAQEAFGHIYASPVG